MRIATRLGFTLALSSLFPMTATAVTYVVPPDRVLIGKAEAIVVARALHSHVEESEERGIETVTVFAVEDRIKGDRSLANGLTVRVPGGVIEEDGKPVRMKVVYGAPRFPNGEAVLLFASRGAGGNYYVTDFGLGDFRFAIDDLGTEVLVRGATEINGWKPDGTPHREPRRHAERFVQFVRDTVGFARSTDDYTIEARAVVGNSGTIERTGALRMTTSACVGCTVTQYTLASTTEGSAGFRWKTFPVNWNRGSVAPNATNSGNDVINLAFNSWKTGSSTNYVLATFNANTNGIYQAPDSVNNIVFEKDMTAVGITAFSCASGGVLGVAGAQSAVSDGTNMVNGETFFRNTEGDVSMNQGLGVCLPAWIDAFTSGLTHEVGHTLGFRHADKSRDLSNSPCTGFASYDCENSAIMTAIVTGGLNGVLAPWDQRAVSALYPVVAPSVMAPTGVTAVPGTSAICGGGVGEDPICSQSIVVSWNTVVGAASYRIEQSTGAAYTQVGTVTSPTLTFNHSATQGTAVLYRVIAVDAGSNASLPSAPDFVFAYMLGNLSGQPIRKSNVDILRTGANEVRRLGGLSPFSFAVDATITAGSTTIKAAHVTQLRTAITEARTAFGLGSSFVEAVTGATTVKASHFSEIYNFMR